MKNSFKKQCPPLIIKGFNTTNKMGYIWIIIAVLSLTNNSNGKFIVLSTMYIKNYY